VQKVEAVLQSAEVMMRDGQHASAQGLLATYVQEDPYRSDHRFHGWLGLCCFQLAKEGREADRARGVVGLSVNAGPGARRRAHATDAREHLLRALELNPQGDQYVRSLAQVLAWGGGSGLPVAKNLLTNFCVLNPNNPEGFRLLCELLRHTSASERDVAGAGTAKSAQGAGSNSELLSAAVHLARCDPGSVLAWEILALAHNQDEFGSTELAALREMRRRALPAHTADASG
jgi:predicted Zn-dependent protease